MAAPGEGGVEYDPVGGRESMVQRTAIALACLLVLTSACAPVGPTSLAVDTSALTAATLGAAQAQIAQTAPQPTPGTDFQFPPPAPNQTPGPNVVAPSPLDDRTPPPPIQMAPSAGAPPANSEQLIQPVNPSTAGSAQGLLAYVVNRSSNDVTVVDLAGNQVRGTIGVGREPQEVAAAPDGSRVYVANRADNSISVIDPAA